MFEQISNSMIFEIIKCTSVKMVFINKYGLLKFFILTYFRITLIYMYLRAYTCINVHTKELHECLT
jgi:hypothetical protein